jgi:hypothetical protein
MIAYHRENTGKGQPFFKDFISVFLIAFNYFTSKRSNVHMHRTAGGASRRFVPQAFFIAFFKKAFVHEFPLKNNMEGDQ